MANAKKSPAKKTAKGKPAPRKNAAARKPAARKKPAPKKPASKKPAVSKKAKAAKARATSGASAPRGESGASQQAPGSGPKSYKPQIAAAAEAIESTISDFIETADVRNFPDKMWRLLAMIAFAFVGYWVFVITVILAAMQWVVVLLGDKPSPEIAHYMERSSAYVRQVLDLLSYRSEALPWPLGPLPE